MLQKRFARTIPVDATLSSRLIHSEPSSPEEARYDRIHFNDFGYVEIARKLKPILENLRASEGRNGPAR